MKIETFWDDAHPERASDAQLNNVDIKLFESILNNLSYNC